MVAESFERDEWEPMKGAWAVQRKVVDAMLHVLEGSSATPNDLLDAVENTQLVRLQVRSVLRDLIDKYVQRRHGVSLFARDQQGDSHFDARAVRLFRRDLTKQQQWLEENKNIPVGAAWNIQTRELRDAIHKEYGSQ